MKETLQDLMTRRACRAYEEKQVPKDVLEEILQAGTYAPTGMGKQSPVIVAVQDPETLAKVEALNAAATGDPSAHPFYGAPTVVTVFADSENPLSVSDANLVLGNILNAAHALGIDSCYIWRAKESFDSEEGKALKKEWGLEDKYVGAGNVILGYGKEKGRNVAPPRKENYYCII